MKPKTYRILGVIFCLLGALLFGLRLQDATPLWRKLLSLVWIVIGVFYLARARSLEQRQP